ncbi:hypothetical protein C4F50_04725 [Flavobacterium sp. KB82]|uniref:Uncharacterized protein n=1 Tax=Flavobacterium hungaricum TaxID=2082725 RepID=A0ABR9TFW5_9FLAO|nr:hypothetical protein [Flavobacterium hungaricum]
MVILNSNKKKKIILFSLGIIFILLISRFLYFRAYDSINVNKCEESNSNVIIQFSEYQVKDIKKLKILVIQKGNFKKEISKRK